MANIGDVARAAGVSRSTVSYALSGKRSISEDTRRRIQESIAQLGFTPHAGARALATAQTRIIGLFVQFLEAEFPPAMLQYVLPISDAAREHGYDVLMVTDPDGPAALQRISQSGMVDGLLLLNVAHHDVRLPALRAARQPSSMVGFPGEAPGSDVFDLDFEASARLIVDHLHGLGHRSIVTVSPQRQMIERGGAYVWRFRDAALERAGELGMRIRPYYGETQQPAIRELWHEILDQRADATALVVHNDAMVAALPSALTAHGLTAPDDLSVVGMFSAEFGREFSLPFTSVETAPDALGRRAVEILVRRMAGEEGLPDPAVRFIEPALVDRGSTGAPAA